MRCTLRPAAATPGAGRCYSKSRRCVRGSPTCACRPNPRCRSQQRGAARRIAHPQAGARRVSVVTGRPPRRPGCRPRSRSGAWVANCCAVTVDELGMFCDSTGRCRRRSGATVRCRSRSGCRVAAKFVQAATSWSESLVSSPLSGCGTPSCRRARAGTGTGCRSCARRAGRTRASTGSSTGRSDNRTGTRTPEPTSTAGCHVQGAAGARIGERGVVGQQRGRVVRQRVLGEHLVDRARRDTPAARRRGRRCRCRPGVTLGDVVLGAHRLLRRAGEVLGDADG